MHFAGTMSALRRVMIAFAGALGGTGSTSTVTGGSGTVTVPAGSSGEITISTDELGAGVGNLEHNKAGAGFVTTGGTITFSNGDSIVFRVTGAAASGDGLNVTLLDGTLTSTAFSLQRTS